MKWKFTIIFHRAYHKCSTVFNSKNSKNWRAWIPYSHKRHSLSYFLSSLQKTRCFISSRSLLANEGSNRTKRVAVFIFMKKSACLIPILINLVCPHLMKEKRCVVCRKSNNVTYNLQEIFLCLWSWFEKLSNDTNIWNFYCLQLHKSHIDCSLRLLQYHFLFYH